MVLSLEGYVLLGVGTVDVVGGGHGAVCAWGLEVAFAFGSLGIVGAIVEEGVVGDVADGGAEGVGDSDIGAEGGGGEGGDFFGVVGVGAESGDPFGFGVGVFGVDGFGVSIFEVVGHDAFEGFEGGVGGADGGVGFDGEADGDEDADEDDDDGDDDEDFDECEGAGGAWLGFGIWDERVAGHFWVLREGVWGLVIGHDEVVGGVGGFVGAWGDEEVGGGAGDGAGGGDGVGGGSEEFEEGWGGGGGISERSGAVGGEAVVV